MEALKVALIGAGKHGVQGYLPIIKAMADRFQLVAICDVNSAVASSVAQHHGVRAYTGLDSLFEHEQIDFCVLTVPAQLNQTVAIQVIQFDMSFLMATPIAVDLSSADQLSRLARAHNTTFEVAENYYRQPHEAIKRLLIQEGILGNINFAYCRFLCHGYHAISLLRSYIGFEIPPVRVSGFQCDYPAEAYAWPSGSSKSATTERWQHGVIEFSGGPHGVYDFTSLSYDSPLRLNPNRVTTEIYGEKGMCLGLEPTLISGGEASEPLIIRRRVKEVEGVEVLDAYVAETLPQIVWENPFRQYPLTDGQIGMAASLMSIANAVREGGAPEYGFVNARTDREIDLAMAWSWDRGGKPVELM